jgi:hypothetical protein
LQGGNKSAVGCGDPRDPGALALPPRTAALPERVAHEFVRRADRNYLQLAIADRCVHCLADFHRDSACPTTGRSAASGGREGTRRRRSRQQSLASRITSCPESIARCKRDRPGFSLRALVKMHSIMRTRRRCRLVGCCVTRLLHKITTAPQPPQPEMASTLMTLKRLAGYRNDRDGGRVKALWSLLLCSCEMLRWQSSEMILRRLPPRDWRRSTTLSRQRATVRHHELPLPSSSLHPHTHAL